MCGIFAVIMKNNIPLSDLFSFSDLNTYFYRLRHRGPDDSSIVYEQNFFLGFHRLSINDTSSSGNQPFLLDDSFTLCNGEIYNYNELFESFNTQINDPLLKSNSDCEILSHLFNSSLDPFDICSNIDGVFACIHFNPSINKLIVSRDPIGVRPLFFINSPNFFAFASEAKALFDLGKPKIFPIGSFMTFDGSFHEYFNLSPSSVSVLNYNTLHTLLYQAVKKRLDSSDVEYGFFLSGGLDSSLIAYIAHDIYPFKKFKTFSIGTNINSPDLINARKVANIINSEHHEVIFDVNKGLRLFSKVIYSLESYDCTTIRASIPMYILSSYISKNTNVKVLLSGEGADELFGGYLYFHNFPDLISFQDETIRLLNNVHMFDSLRADRATSSFGLEIRVPFFDKTLLNYVLSLHPSCKIPKKNFEKFILRHTFNNTFHPDFDQILWRQKNAFSDAVGYNWIDSIKSFVNSIHVDTNVSYDIDQPLSREEFYYRKIFSNLFGSSPLASHSIWRHNWSNNQIDPSATYLSHHLNSRS